MKMVIICFLIALAAALMAGPLIIPALKKFKFGQNIRSDGPSRHLKKAGTPTMGGIIFLLAVTVAVMATAWNQPIAIFILLITWLFGIIGLLDDSLKIIRHRSEGLTPRQKMLGQLLASLLLIAGAVWYFDCGTGLLIPFSGFFIAGGIVWQLPLVVFILLALLVIVGTVNAVNLTDGLDGLAVGITFITTLAYLFLSMNCGLEGITLYLASLAGGCLGFWFFNRYPAKVFMGDTGSLALGGALAACAVLSGTELFLFIVGAVFVLETLSVMIQVTSYKLTRKRVFRMAPLHHHFELGGWSEIKVVGVFWLCSFICSVIGMISSYNIY